MLENVDPSELLHPFVHHLDEFPGASAHVLAERVCSFVSRGDKACVEHVEHGNPLVRDKSDTRDFASDAVDSGVGAAHRIGHVAVL